MAVMNTLTLPDAPAAVATNEGSIFFIGNATVLIRVAGFTILTDPTFIHKHEQTWLGGGLHTTRLTDPAIELADLPPLDLVLLSHFHGDHFDQVAERDLDRTLPIVTTPQSANDLEERGFTNCIPLDVWESVNVEKGSARLLITATPARHGPPLVDFVLPDVMGSVLDVTRADGGASRIYITGDTLVIDELREIRGASPTSTSPCCTSAERGCWGSWSAWTRSRAWKRCGSSILPSPSRSTTTTTTSSPPRSRISRTRCAPRDWRTGSIT